MYGVGQMRKVEPKRGKAKSYGYTCAHAKGLAEAGGTQKAICMYTLGQMRQVPSKGGARKKVRDFLGQVQKVYSKRERQ